VLDGWSDGGRHLVAIFAVFDDPSLNVGDRTETSKDYYKGLDCPTRRFVLLVFSPADEEEDLSALSLFDFIADTLSRYENPWESVAFLVGDNCRRGSAGLSPL
jgi:hypothetical protein